MRLTKAVVYSVWLCLLCFSGNVRATLAAGDYEFSVSMDGDKRPYLVHVPDQSQTGKALPMVLVLQWWPGQHAGAGQ